MPETLLLKAGLFCKGQHLLIISNPALFSLIGTTYGGDRNTTFALPDLRGRIPVGVDSRPGVSTIARGQVLKTEINTLTIANLPPHSHTVNTTITRSSNTPDDTGAFNNEYATTNGSTTALQPSMIENTAQDLPAIKQASLIGIRYIICLKGVYPSEN